MRIDGLGPPPPLTPLTPAPAPGGAAAANAPSFTGAASAQTLALQQLEQQSGGGGGGGHGGGHAGHGGNKALTAIDEIAARASLNVTARAKTTADRIRDIEHLRAELAETQDDDAAGEREPDRRDEPAGQDAPRDED